MTVSTLEQLLAPYRNQSAWVLPLSDERGRTFANNGDLLMHRIFEDLCADFEIALTDKPENADFIAVPPNGALLDRFKAPDIVRNRLRPYPDKPLVIFPSSAQFLTRNPKEMFGSRSAPTLWILREPYSLAHLENDWGVDLAESGVTLSLSHDVVITGSTHVAKYFHDRRTNDHGKALLASRLGVEAKDIRNGQGLSDRYDTRAGSKVKKLVVAVSRSLPHALLRPARRISTRNRIIHANRSLLEAVPSTVRSAFDHKTISAATDISDTSLVSFDEYCDRIAAAELVVTNRLHVAIPAALLGKDTYLVDSGYHKLKGIFEQSLQGLDNLTFVPRS